jgi:hypothetical protein
LRELGECNKRNVLPTYLKTTPSFIFLKVSGVTESSSNNRGVRRTGNERDEAVSTAVANSINPGLQPAPLAPPSEGHTMSLADTFVKALAKAQKLSKATPLKVQPPLKQTSLRLKKLGPLLEDLCAS